MCARLRSLLLVVLPTSLLALEEETHSIDTRGYVFDQKGKYVKTNSVYMYMVIYSALISVILVVGFINLCLIRCYYRRKCREILGQMEADRAKKLKDEGDPSPFAVHPVRAGHLDEASRKEERKQTQQMVWDPSTLAQVCHLMQPNREDADFFHNQPYRGVVLNTREQAEQGVVPEAVGFDAPLSSVVVNSGVQATSNFSKL